MASSGNLSYDVEVGGLESWANRARAERDNGDSIVAVVFVDWNETNPSDRRIDNTETWNGVAYGCPSTPIGSGILDSTMSWAGAHLAILMGGIGLEGRGCGLQPADITE